MKFTQNVDTVLLKPSNVIDMIVLPTKESGIKNETPQANFMSKSSTLIALSLSNRNQRPTNFASG